MPDEVRALLFHREGDHANGVDNAATKDQDEHPEIVLHHARNEKKSAPADQKIKRKVYGAESRGAEDTDERDARNDQAPLNTEHDDPLCIAPVDEAQRRERTADQKIDRGIIESAPELLHGKTVLPGMVKAAHGEKKDHADAVKARRHDFHRGIRLKEHRDKGSDRQRRADPVRDRVADLLEERQLRRFISLFDLFLGHTHILFVRQVLFKRKEPMEKALFSAPKAPVRAPFHTPSGIERNRRLCYIFFISEVWE